MPQPPIGPYIHLPTVCQEYDPRTPQVVHLLSEMITERLPWATIEHVGSTAVPGCAGKGVIDLMISYEDEQQLSHIKAALADLGYQRQTTRDPFPEDRPIRIGSVEYEGTRYRIHVHVVPITDPDFVGMRTFRDQLCTDPALVAVYVARKRAILEEGITDSVDYAEAKAGFVRGTLAQLMDQTCGTDQDTAVF